MYQKCLEKLKLITQSSLLPWQTLDAVKIFIHSKLIFYFRNYATSAALIRANSDVISLGGMQKGFDFSYRAEIRRILKHNSSSSVDYLYTPVELGGCGCVSAWDEYRIQSIVQLLRMLTARDPLIIEAANNPYTNWTPTQKHRLNSH